MEEQLALYKQQGLPDNQPSKKKKSTLNELPSQLALQRVFADFHHLPDSIVAMACKNGDIATV